MLVINLNNQSKTCHSYLWISSCNVHVSVLKIITTIKVSLVDFIFNHPNNKLGVPILQMRKLAKLPAWAGKREDGNLNLGLSVSFAQYLPLHQTLGCIFTPSLFQSLWKFRR